jgi:ureidoacrylate peracid hydrolase
VGSWGAEFYKLTPAQGESVVAKHRYSGFVGTELESFCVQQSNAACL